MAFSAKLKHAGASPAQAKSVEKAKTRAEILVSDVENDGVDCGGNPRVRPLAMRDATGAVSQGSPCVIQIVNVARPCCVDAFTKFASSAQNVPAVSQQMALTDPS